MLGTGVQLSAIHARAAAAASVCEPRSEPLLESEPSLQLAVQLQLMSLVSCVPGPGQSVPIHAPAAADARASVAWPEPLLLPEPSLQLAVQDQLVVLLTAGGEGGGGHVVSTQACAAVSAADRVA